MQRPSLRLQALQNLQRQAYQRQAPQLHQQAIINLLSRLKAEQAGTPQPKMDYRNADKANAFPMAIEAMRNAAFLKTPRYQEQKSRANRDGADIRILEFSDKLIKRCASLGIPVFALCIVRTQEEQQSAYARGVSRDSPSDGLWPHMGFAVDIIHGTRGYMDDENHVPHGWDVIGHLGKEVAHSMDLKVTWGGDWKFYDPAHWEIADWKEHVLLGGKVMR